MKTRSKYILLLFMGIIVLLLGGIFFVAQQEKEGPITAEASGPVYWLSEGSSLSTTSCLLCGQSVSASSGTSVAWQSTGTCSMDYYHWGPRGARICYAPITVHNGHFYQMDATCTKDGESYTVCTRCGTRTNETTIPATGHDYGEWFVATPATCTQNGTEQRVCQNSGCSARETRTIEATGHTWDSGTVTVSATCQRTGTRKYECTACGETKTETIAKRNHNYNIYLSRVEPTCTASGRTAGYECQWCYANTCSTIPALGHDLEHHDGQPATCTEIGWNDYETCSRCDYTTYREIAATGHTPGAAATCTTPQTCTECGAILVEALGHKTVSHLGQDPTCTAEGWKPYETCENCDYTTYEIIPALGHSFTSYVSNNDATCTDDGTETAKCDRCEVTDTRTDEGSALGHDWAEEWTTDGTAHWHECSRCDEINDKANHSGGTATCIALAKCEICGAKYGDLAEHVYVENAEEQYLVSAATCTAKATYYKSCSVCGEAGEEVFEYGEPLGHEYGEPEWTWEGYTSATATFTCTRGCGNKQTATASGSSITNVVTTPAECEKEGLRTYTARVTFGGEEYTATTTETLAALGHDLEHHEAKPATCTEIGWEAYDTCSRCDYTTYVEIEALGHNWAEEWTTDGTSHWHECSRCDEINDKANHSGGEATCTNPAECEVCGAEYGEALGHTEGEAVRENEVSASCTAAGSYDEVVYCSVCGEELSRGEKVIEALGHDLEHHEAKPATCTEIGWNAYDTCTRCDYTTYVEIEALGHDWAEEWTTDGTAHWHECSRCDEINDKANHSGGTATCINPAECEVCGVEYGEALGHTEGEAARENEVPASCTAAGSYDEVVYCSVCGEELSREEKVIDALGHSFTNYVSDNNATCTEDGTETAKCDRCEVTDTRMDEGSALGHDWAKEWTTDGTSHWHECSRCDEINDKANHSGGEATCTNPAECEVCGAEYGEALDHDFEHHEAKPATCTEIGWEAYDTCTRCDYTTYVEIAAKGHTFGPDATCTEDQVCLECGEVISAATGHIPGPDATCTENQTCSVCGEILTPALGHSFTSYISDNNATCTEDGTETAKCDRCEVTDTRTDEGSALGHDLEHHEAKPATCTEIGWNAYDTCTRCDYTTYVEIEALGHNWAEEWTTDGTAHWHECSRCDEINDKANHSGGEATCTNPAECEVCGVEYGSALGHTESEAVRENEVPASCTVAGSYDEVVYCSVCGEELSREEKVIDALGHSFTSYISDNNATCTEDGTETAKCDRCEVTDTRTDEGSALGHNWAEEWTTDGTAHWHKCSRCDEINDKANHSGGTATCIALAKCEICGVEYGDFAEHVYVENAEEQYLVSAATCTAKATYYKSCSVCGEAGEEIFEYGEPLGHEYGEPEWTWEGYTSATATFTCTRGCGDKQTITASGSSITNVVTTPAECETEGLRTYTAKVMFGGEEYVTTTTETIEALGHDLEHHEAQPATCIEIGWNAYDTCTRCDYTTYVEIEALGHTEGEAVRENEVPASCTAAGSYDEVVYCSVCGEELSREEKVIDALGHDLEHHEAKPATCTEIGWDAYDTCSRCDYTTYIEIEALGHTEGEAVRENEVPASCTAAGSYDEVVYCSVCGEELSREEKVIDALGHSFTNYVSDNNATCTEDGTETAKCDRCDVTDTRTDEGSALGHTESEAVRENEVPASCTAAGSYDEVIYCSVCGDELSREGKVIDALGHSFTSYVSDNNATCTEDGTETAKCDRCEVTDTRTDEGSALGHDWAEEWTTDGTAHWHECSRCDEINDKASHSGGTATCIALAKCEICGVEYGDFAEHNFVDGYCTVCGIIDGTALDNDKDDAKADLDEIAQDAKDEIDGSDLPDDVKDDLKDKVDEIINGAKVEVEGSTDFDDVDQTVENAKDEIEDAILDAEKDDAKSDLDEIAQNVKDEIDGSELSDEEKTELKDKIDEIVNDAKAEIEGASSKDEIEESFSEAESGIEEVNREALENAKEDVLAELEELAQSIKDEIDGSDLSDGAKNQLKDKIDEIIENANSELESKTTFDEVYELGDVIKSEISAVKEEAITIAKEEAVAALEAYVESAKNEIAASDLSTEEQADHTGQIDAEAESTKEEIVAATDFETIANALKEAMEEIDRIQAIGHIAGPAATCTTPQVCTVCGKELAPALGHDEIEHDGQPATCTEAGWADYVTCSRCDYSTYQTIPALGHTKSDPVRENVVEASCTAAGSYDEVVYCSVCGEELSREEKVVEALGHDLVKHEGQAATCTQNGWNDYETCTRCDYTTYREIAATGHTPGAAATCTSAQRCTVCGTTLVPARGHHFVDGYCSVCGAIDGTALDNDKDDAKTDLDDIAQDAKDEIDGSDLPDDVKEDLKDKVDEIINGAKDEVEGSTDFDDIDQAVENTKDEIEDAILDAEKDDAKSDLDEIAQGAKDEVDGSDLPDDVKDDLKDKIDEIVNDAKTEIDGETSKEEVDQTVEDAQQEIEDAILNAEKDDAKSDLDKIAQSAKDEIGSSGISDEEKAELKDKVDAAIEDAKEAIDNATSKEEIENIVNDTREDIDDLLKGSLDNELAEKKDAAISDLTEIAQDAKDGIDGSDISDEEKDELKGKVDEIVNDAKDEIEGAVTPEEIDEILAEAENEIAAVTEDLKAGQLNTSTLWPWIIVAIVISAALSTLFAWRHVKKVQGKGEAVGAKSVVTIAVATILIFVVVIGITLLIFAMV